MFVGRPPKSAVFSRIGGAYINVWVAHSDEAIAEQIARDAISNEQWRGEQLEECQLVTREIYRNLPESLQHFEQAVDAGYSLEFHTWPPEGEDE
jgi:hypothetical protein